jgi:ribosomal protein L18
MKIYQQHALPPVRLQVQRTAKAASLQLARLRQEKKLTEASSAQGDIANAAIEKA